MSGQIGRWKSTPYGAWSGCIRRWSWRGKKRQTMENLQSAGRRRRCRVSPDGMHARRDILHTSYILPTYCMYKYVRDTYMYSVRVYSLAIVDPLEQVRHLQVQVTTVTQKWPNAVRVSQANHRRPDPNIPKRRAKARIVLPSPLSLTSASPSLADGTMECASRFSSHSSDNMSGLRIRRD